MDIVNPPTRDPGVTTVRLGVDVGKQQDPTALVVTEQVMRANLPHFLVRSLERMPLGTSYPLVADRIEQVMTRLEAKGRPRLGPRLFVVVLIVDATGVGLAVGDLLRERGLHPKLAMFTGSDSLTEHPGDVVSIGKGWMVSRLQVLLQSRRLHLPATGEAVALMKELQDYEINVSDRGHASFNAKSGKHDDLVIALGLSCGIERSMATATSRNYLAPREESLEDSLRDRYVRRLEAEQ